MNNTEKILNELVRCPICQRRMRQEVFLKHPNVCRKNPSNKRNVFDMTNYRSVKTGDQIIPVQKMSTIFVDKPENINARSSQTRSVKRDRHADTLVPPIIDNFCCPICKRKFCEKAYDRHAAFCASKTKQIQQSPTEDVLLARLRLGRRIRFGSNRVSSTSSPAIEKPLSTSTGSKQSIRNNSSFSLLSLSKKNSIS
ncbi:unnamed protein product [Rotaria socialis]|uniref:Uncharacterized protein n=1 Tax=Rotaria socialis TaxID=392032 RepID=A0A820Z8P6_9BILA|nr:unnamed protein product [Rotaria socialis]CAF3556405.1 unnamed protein product [Rotaria socialis]CAF4556808.1 unnamed protein product [Rotaria socialis]CAF4916989.1 unnamed protein product [Rotaria socialis]